VLERADVPLAPLTTLRLGGPARRLVTAYTAAEVVEAVTPAAFVLGGGSNVVLPDAGLDEVVLVRSHGLHGQRDGDRVLLRVEAGEDWDGLVATTVADGLVGLEALSGIPGTVGASPVQNIGAYGAEVAGTVVSVTALDRLSGAVVDLPAADCGFGYRTSRFKQTGTWVVLSVVFSLRTGVLGDPVRYAELARVLGVELGQAAPAGAVRESVLALRRGKGMVLDPADPDSVSAGSFFTNPVVPLDRVPDGAASWPDAEGGAKVSAAWLIEESGFVRGWGDGPVGLSSKHTLALVNRGGAQTSDLLRTARVVRDGVRDRFGITLVPEPVVVGEQV